MPRSSRDRGKSIGIRSDVAELKIVAKKCGRRARGSLLSHSAGPNAKDVMSDNGELHELEAL